MKRSKWLSFVTMLMVVVMIVVGNVGVAMAAEPENHIETQAVVTGPATGSFSAGNVDLNNGQVGGRLLISEGYQLLAEASISNPKGTGAEVSVVGIAAFLYSIEVTDPNGSVVYSKLRGQQYAFGEQLRDGGPYAATQSVSSSGSLVFDEDVHFSATSVGRYQVEVTFSPYIYAFGWVCAAPLYPHSPEYYYRYASAQTGSEATTFTFQLNVEQSYEVCTEMTDWTLVNTGDWIWDESKKDFYRILEYERYDLNDASHLCDTKQETEWQSYEVCTEVGDPVYLDWTDWTWDPVQEDFFRTRLVSYYDKYDTEHLCYQESEKEWQGYQPIPQEEYKPTHLQICPKGQNAGDRNDRHDQMGGACGAGLVTEDEVRAANSGNIPGSNLVHPLNKDEQVVEIVLVTFDETSPDVTKYRSPVVTGIYPVSYFPWAMVSKGRILGELPREGGVFVAKSGRSVTVFGIYPPGTDRVDGKEEDRVINFSLVFHLNGVGWADVDTFASDSWKDPGMQDLMESYAWAVQRELVRLGFSVVDNNLAGNYLVPNGFESLWEDPNDGCTPNLKEMLSLLMGRHLLVGTLHEGLPAFVRQDPDGDFSDWRENTNQFRSSLLASSVVNLRVVGKPPEDYGQFAVDSHIKFVDG